MKMIARIKKLVGALFAAIGVLTSLIACYDYWVAPDIHIRFPKSADGVVAGPVYHILPYWHQIAKGDLLMVLRSPSPQSSLGVDHIFRISVDNQQMKLQADVEFDLYNTGYKPITVFEPLGGSSLGMNVFFAYSNVTGERALSERISCRLRGTQLAMIVKGHDGNDYVSIKFPKDIFPLYLNGKESRRIKASVDLTPVFTKTPLKKYLSAKESEVPVVLSLCSLNVQTTAGLKELTRVIGFALYRSDLDGKWTASEVK